VKHWEKLFGITDFICFYSGEGPTDALIDFADGKKGIEEIPGVAYLKDGKVKENALPPALDIRKTPLPDFSDLPLDLYPRRALPYQTTAGCEWGKCTFCYHCFPDNKVISKSAAKIADELCELSVKYGVDTFSLADLSTPYKILNGVSREFIKRRTTLKWDALTRACRPYTRIFAGRLKAAGCCELFFGLENPDPEELTGINKGIKLSDFEKTARECVSAGINVSVFLLNYPGLSDEKYRAAIDYFSRLNDDNTAEIKAVMADFELGRSSNAMKNLENFGIKLSPDSITDLRSFRLPFFTEYKWENRKTEESDWLIRAKMP